MHHAAKNVREILLNSIPVNLAKATSMTSQRHLTWGKVSYCISMIAYVVKLTNFDPESPSRWSFRVSIVQLTTTEAWHTFKPMPAPGCEMIWMCSSNSQILELPAGLLQWFWLGWSLKLDNSLSFQVVLCHGRPITRNNAPCRFLSNSAEKCEKGLVIF